MHVVLWVPLVLVLCLGMLRPLKGVLVALQYHHQAEEGRIHRGRLRWRARLRGLILPALLRSPRFAVLVSLGNWQVRRLAWKEDLIARATERPNGPVARLPAASAWPSLDVARRTNTGPSG